MCRLPGKLTIVIFIAFLLAPAAAGDAPPPMRPNLVVILADDFGYECVGANGSESYRTPAIDALARAGMRFEHCYSQPLCTPTRVQLLTGLYNQRNYVRFGYLDPNAATFAQVLRQAGYRTCVAGKWQLDGGPDAPQRFGFDEHLLWQLTVRKSRYANPVLERDGRVTEHRGKYGPDLVSDFVVDFMRRHRDEPFLVFYPMLLTHAPFEPTPASLARDPQAGGGGERGDARHFADMVAYADKMVGKVVTALDELGLRQRTLVLFTADNGTGKGIVSRLAGREVKGGKGEMTDAGTRVPLIASWPGVVPAGAVCGDLVDSTDFLPTLLEAAGAGLPASFEPDGRSFLPQIRGEQGWPRQWVYSWYSRDGGPGVRELARTRRFKLHGDGRFLDLSSDPDEARDLGKGPFSPEADAARELLAGVLQSQRRTRRISEAPAAPPQAADVARRIEAVEGRVFRQDDRIVEVILDGREVTGDLLGALGGLGDLTDLSLERTRVNDAGIELLVGPENPERLAKLEWLNLYRTEIGDASLAHLIRLKGLKLLPIGETRVTDAGLAHLGRMTQLQYLGLRGNRVTDAGLEHVARLAGLTGLHLGDTGVTDAGIARLRALAKLEKLWLDGTTVTDASVEPLASLRALKELHLAETKLTPRGIAGLREALPECRVENER